MQAGRKKSKRYWPAIILATILAETAHAPLRGRADAADMNSDFDSRVVSAKSRSQAANKKLPPSLSLPQAADVQLPQGKQNPPPELAKLDPFMTLPLPPLLVHAANPPLDAGVQTVSLLNAGDPRSSGPTPGDGAEPILSTVPPNRPTEPTGDPVETVSIPPIEAAPVARTPDPIVSVPEPECISMIMGGTMLLGRRRIRLPLGMRSRGRIFRGI